MQKIPHLLLLALFFANLLQAGDQQESRAASSQHTQSSPPNIIFIFADDLGWGDLSRYGNTRIETPELDQLANEGTLYTHFYVPGSVCSPTRVGIMTGQYPARHRTFGHFGTGKLNERRGMPDHLDTDAYTLTDLLRDVGYTTAHFGKWHLGMRNPPAPSEYGVDFYRTNIDSNIAGKEPMDISSPDARPVSSKRILDETLEFIREHKEEPFYVNAWLFDMHSTLNPSAEQLAPFKRFKPRNVDFHGIEEVYFAALAEMDRQIGRFMDELDAMGLAENTLVIFSSDNGPEDYVITSTAHSGAGSAGPFRGRKRSLYEGGIRMPFILRWPGQVPAGVVNDHSIVNGVDFLPTLAALTQAELPESFAPDGENMLPVWLGATTQRSRPIFWEWRYDVYGHPMHRSPRIAMREGDYKLLFNPDRSRVELYNVVADPAEMQNLAKEQPELTERMLQSAQAWFDTLPESKPDARAGRNDWKWPK